MNTISKPAIKIGETVFYKESWTNNIIKGVVSNIDTDLDGNKVYFTENECFVDSKGNPLEITGDEALFRSVADIGHYQSDLYTDIKSAKKEFDKKEKALYDSYCAEIRDLKTLLVFPLKHYLQENKLTDIIALKAYRKRARDLFGVWINIENEK